MRRRRSLGGAVLFGIALLVLPVMPPTARALGPVPDCRLDEIMTVPRGYDDWSHTLVDWLLRVEADYVPPDLVPVGEAGVPGGGFVRAVAIDDLRAMGEASRAAGAAIGVWSPYRSYDEQVRIHDDYVAIDGEEANTYSMPPGHSEHQLGLGVDFMSAGGGSPLKGDWAYETKAGAWMKENAWKYGWVMSYPIPPDQVGTTNLWSDKVCFTYEPWHYRYLGREVAAQVHESGLTIREYLWMNFTMVDPETGDPLATPTPIRTESTTPSPSPISTPTQGSTASPSPSASPTEPSGADELVGLPIDPLLLFGGGAALILLLVLVVYATILRAARRGGLRR